MEVHFCTICNNRVLFGIEPHHGSTWNHYACEAPRIKKFEGLTYEEATARGDAAIRKLEDLIKQLPKD
jgi:hypothetical protein